MRNRQHRFRSIAATSALLVAAMLGHAWAQSAEAEALFDEADKDIAAGKIAEACAAFEASNIAESRAGTLIRLGECREQNHQLASAWSAYRDALTRVKDPRKKTYAESRIAALEPQLSYLTIDVPDAARLDGLELTRDGKPVDARLWNHALAIDGGDYAIVAHAPGHADWSTTAHVATQGAKIEVAVPRLADVPTSAPAPVPAIPVAAKPMAPAGGSHVLTTQRDVAIGVAGVAVAGAIAGAVLGASAKSDQDAAFELCPSTSTPCADAAKATQLLKTGHGRAIDANVAFGVGGAAAIAAVVLWITGGARDAESSKGIAVAPAANGIVVIGSF